MNKLKIAAALLVTLAAGVASAHPINVPYDTRGDCEVAYANSSKLDRERLVALGVFETKGAAQSVFRDIFKCEYDEEEDAWFVVFTP